MRLGGCPQAWQKVMSAYWTGGFVRNVICELTLWRLGSALANGYGNTFTFIFFGDAVAEATQHLPHILNTLSFEQSLLYVMSICDLCVLNSP